ncbi:hypothetical protein [Colwellia sp. RSH04]|uniref:hypothetical protein n=1 Tax=Colwellia sp. RSH04 TaxID=2305464 RepID=UPI000E57D7B8|nr:hypothetical protein [Colwellia sp. RSH04]RHW76697.1 hypothetical protein D1094_06345 [Colwellia sp. RSH04]
MDSLKRKFFIYHLSVSIITVILLSSICQFYWFPSPFLLLDGTWIALLTLALVDIIIGPLLTLLLVSSKKSSKEIIFDMVVIITIQVSALSYGLIKIEQERVWAIVHLDGVFNLAPKKEILINYQNMEQELPKFKGIYYAMVLNSEMLLHSQSKNSTKPLMYSPERYHPINNNILATAIPYRNLPREIQKQYNEQYRFKLLIGKRMNAVIILSKELEIIDIAPLNENKIKIPTI